MTKRRADPKPSTAPKRPRGRPCTYNEETANRICERMSAGESLNRICSDADMPPVSTVRHWVIYDHQGFAAKYARARELQADAWASELVDLARNVPPDSNHVAKARLEIDTVKWVACKLLPKKYGEKLDASLTGANGGPVLVSTALSPLSALPKAELQIINEILTRRAGALDKGGDGGEDQQQS
jgi:hypothetical protein